MMQKITSKCLVGCRVLVEVVLNVAGLFRFSPLLRRHPEGGKKRIAFQAYSIHLAQHYQTIIAELRNEPGEFEIVFIVLPHPHFPLQSMRSLGAFARSQLGIPGANIHYYWQTLWEKFDLVMYNDVYARFSLRSGKKCLLQHGAIISERWVKGHFLRKTFSDFDIVLLNGKVDHDFLKQRHADRFNTVKAYHIGLPFLDRLNLLDEDPGHYLGRLAHRRQKMNVLFAPSWSGLNSLENCGTAYIDQVVTILLQMDLNIIIKLHSCSFNKIMAGGIDWKKHLQKFSAYESVKIDYDVDDVPALKYCDVLITDISSRSFNFMLLGKPVIFYFPATETREKRDANRIELVKQNAFTAMSPENITEILHQLMAHDAYKTATLSMVDHLFSNYGEATKAAVNIIKENLPGSGNAGR